MAIMCNNAKRNGKRTSRVDSIDFRGTKVYSKLKCGNKLVPVGECILSQNWINGFSYKSLKILPSKWLLTYNYNSDSNKESETLYSLPRFKRIREVHICNGYIYCSCKYRNRYGTDYPHIYHVISQSNVFKEPSHHDISVCWWNTFYQISCLSTDNEEFDTLEKAMKILQMNEKDSLAAQLK